MLAQIIGLAVATGIVAVSGVVMTRAGRPYSAVVLNVHKLIDLAAAAVVGVGVYRIHRQTGLPGGVWALVISAGVLFIATLATGGFLSASKSAPGWALRVHRVGSWVAAAALLGSAYAVFR
jgi:hypothetical protein